MYVMCMPACCMSIHCVLCSYSKEWEKTVQRMGRWIDFDNGYRTMDLTFMESVWWVFKQLYDKGLVYRGFKVNRPLSVVYSGHRESSLSCCIPMVLLR